MRRRIFGLLFIACLAVLLALPALRYEKRQTEFYDLFDTQTIVVAYTRTERGFERYGEAVFNSLSALHKEYDIYNDYDGLSNIKAINDNAGIRPVAVSDDVIRLLTLCAEAGAATGGTVNAALGPVLKIWHAYRDEGLRNPDGARLPPRHELEAAKAHTDIGGLIIDGGTAYLKYEGMSLDVGSIAKGYAAGIAAEAAKQAGMRSGIINVGGNIVTVGKPKGREHWEIGIQDPENPGRIIDSVYISDMCAVTSGDYQRYYTVDGERLNHIIDPGTLMPAERYHAVTVLHEDSAMGDILSTALFILPIDEGERLLGQYGGAALWIMKDNTLTATEDYKKVSKYFSDAE